MRRDGGARLRSTSSPGWRETGRTYRGASIPNGASVSSSRLDGGFRLGRVELWIAKVGLYFGDPRACCLLWYAHHLWRSRRWGLWGRRPSSPTEFGPFRDEQSRERAGAAIGS